MSRRKRINLKVSYEVAFSPDGQLLAVIGRDVVLWDFPRGEKRFRVHPLSHPSHVAFSRSGDRLAVKNTAGRIVILDPATGQVAVDFGNKRDGEGCGPVFSPCDATWLTERGTDDFWYATQILEKLSLRLVGPEK